MSATARPHNARTSSTTPASSSTSTLRPRTNRLISGLDQGDETTFDPTTTSSNRIASPLLSPLDTRSASPIPASRLPRTGSSSRAAAQGGVWTPRSRQGPGVGRLGNESPNSLAGLWGNSWNAMQAIASDLLGSDASAPQGKDKDRTARTRRPLSKLRTERGSTSVPPSQWGPTSAPTVNSIGAGTREETDAALRAQKRKDMLMHGESSYADTLGRFKRRTSDDRTAASAPPGENEDRDALVYLHNVQKNDTLAGITIKYNCSANTLRRANRMWPNDLVQSRTTLVLPVDACGVKGRPVSGPEGEADLLGSENEAFQSGVAEEVPSTTQALPNSRDLSGRDRTNSASTNTSRGRPSSSVAGSSIDSDSPWNHDSWVQLPGFPKPTEIARLSRRTLGYFPPARRKSNSYSDLDTPSTSLDLSRTPTSDLLANQPALSPLRQDPPQRPRRTRRLSNANNGYFPSYLAGPGGVGTMGKNVLTPGPAQDGLNKLFAKHLPDVAPPRNQQSLYQPELPLYSDTSTPLASAANTPNHSMNLNLENVGGAIEGWVRKVATRAKGAMEPGERGRGGVRASVGTPGAGRDGMGDLIEMTDEFEIGGDDDDEEYDDERNRGRRGTAVDVGKGGGGTTSGTSYFDVGVRQREGSSKAAAANKAGKHD